MKQTIEEEEEPEDEEEQEEDMTTVTTKKTVAYTDAFAPEQVDIQQQMKDLLKKQKTMKAVEPKNEEIEEDDDGGAGKQDMA